MPRGSIETLQPAFSTYARAVRRAALEPARPVVDLASRYSASYLVARFGDEQIKVG